MGRAFETQDGRLSGQLAAELEPELRDALDHPIRREVLRALAGSRKSHSISELGVELRGFRDGQLYYHLQVLQQAGAVALEPADEGAGQGRARYASAVPEVREVRAVLRATEQWDRKQREAAAAAMASPLLTMFRVPRPVRTIRLRGRREIDGGREC